MVAWRVAQKVCDDNRRSERAISFKIFLVSRAADKIDLAPRLHVAQPCNCRFGLIADIHGADALHDTPPQEFESARKLRPVRIGFWFRDQVAAAGVVGVHDLAHGENMRAYVTLQDNTSRPSASELDSLSALAHSSIAACLRRYSVEPI